MMVLYRFSLLGIAASIKYATLLCQAYLYLVCCWQFDQLLWTCCSVVYNVNSPIQIVIHVYNSVYFPFGSPHLMDIIGYPIVAVGIITLS